jgi:hypothetical protein
VTWLGWLGWLTGRAGWAVLTGWLRWLAGRAGWLGWAGWLGLSLLSFAMAFAFLRQLWAGLVGWDVWRAGWLSAWLDCSGWVGWLSWAVWQAGLGWPAGWPAETCNFETRLHKNTQINLWIILFL